MIKDMDMKYIFDSVSNKNKLTDSVILVTGCAGFIGYYVMNFLYRYGDELSIKKVIGLDSYVMGEPSWLKKISEHPKFDIRRFDIVKNHLHDVNEIESVNWIMDLASIASPVYYREHPIETLDANVFGLRNIFEFYKDKQIKGMCFMSSSEIYGDPSPDNVPTKESYWGNVTSIGPRACYDESKRIGETLCYLFHKKYAMPITIIRPFNNYGPGTRLNDGRVTADFARNILAGEDMVVLSDGRATRTFCYIADAVIGYFKALFYGKFDCFNVGIEEPEITINQLAEIYREQAQKIFNYKGKIIYKTSKDKDYLTDNPNRRCPDMEKARMLLDFTPTIDITEGSERFLQFLKESGESEYIW